MGLWGRKRGQGTSETAEYFSVRGAQTTCLDPLGNHQNCRFLSPTLDLLVGIQGWREGAARLISYEPPGAS